MNNKVEEIHKAYKDHTKGYIVTVEDFLEYLQSKEYNFALWSTGKLIGNYPPSPGGSYFEVSDIAFWVSIENQKESVRDWFYNLLK
jgi:hypothetical protein